MSLYPSSSKNVLPTGQTEFDVLKSSHKFLREDGVKNESWEAQVAQKYYSSLYREFAVCDLKHYKSGNFALRWRTGDEVLSGAGETTCGNTRCKYHDERVPTPPLTTLELPFSYVEHGESKTALVKVVLCGRCCKKLMWKRTKEKELMKHNATGEGLPGTEGGSPQENNITHDDNRRSRERRVHQSSEPRRRNPRSLSPQSRRQKQS